MGIDKMTGSFGYGVPNNGRGGGKAGDTIIDGGGVDWQLTTLENVTGVNGEGYLFATVTTTGSFYLTLPGSPSDGDIIGIGDGEGNASQNIVTVYGGGNSVMGGDNDIVIDSDGGVVIVTYNAANNDWRIISDTRGGGGGAGVIYTTIDASLFDQGGFNTVPIAGAANTVFMIINEVQDTEFVIDMTLMNDGEEFEIFLPSIQNEEQINWSVSTGPHYWRNGEPPQSWDLETGEYQHLRFRMIAGGDTLIQYVGYYGAGMIG